MTHRSARTNKSHQAKDQKASKTTKMPPNTSSVSRSDEWAAPIKDFPSPDTAVDTEFAAQDLDRKWFHTHPGRSYRIRRALPGELLGAPYGQNYIAVCQISPGFRIRAKFSTPVAFPDEKHPEPVAHAYFDFAYEKPNQFVSEAEIYERICLYAEGGNLGEAGDRSPH
jgi:hypothetical protein